MLPLINGNTMTNPYDIAGTFTNYFASLAETTKNNIKYSHKHFSDYLTKQCGVQYFCNLLEKKK